jgi:uncharacterized OsmC-like protein
MMKISFSAAKCRVAFDWFVKGSVLRGDIRSGATAMRTHFTVDSDSPQDDVLKLIRNAKNGCYAEGMVSAAIPITSTVALNGENISLEGITE